MKVSINLLQETQRIQARLRRMGLALQTASVATLLILGAVVFGLLSYTLWTSVRESRLTKDIGSAKAEIEEMRPLESKQVFVRQKFTLISRIFRERGIPHALAMDLYDLGRSEVSVGSVEVVEGENALVMIGTASDVFSLVRFLDDLSEFAETHDVRAIVGNDFSRSPDGSYRFAITLNLMEKR